MAGSKHFYQGKYILKSPAKYHGDSTNVIYRSSWELSMMRWLDTNENVEYWSSEEIKIPYQCVTDNEMHRYFVDFLIKFKNNKTYLVEVKPEKEVLPPKKRNSKRYLLEVLQWGKNQSKWKFAARFAQRKGWIFQVWTEKTFRKLGIPILTGNS